MGGKVAIVTGAGSGIGRAVALAFLAAGYKVALAGRRQTALRETAALGSSSGQEPMIAPTDVRDAGSVAALFDACRDRFGRVDVLFNNAGLMSPPALVEDIALEDWTGLIDTNVTGAFLCIQNAFRIMKAQSPQGGRIINNGSISAHAPRPLSMPYTASKHAMTGLTKAASLDGRAYDIACGQIDIGNATTEMTQEFADGAASRAGPGGEPRFDVVHVARAVLQMAELPLEANVQFMTILATKMPFVGRG
ncbi:MAG: SDR family oxidoreductase [Phenylobacterium sp.]|uniref:SDR family oxidoreductase n=1 Tax=Phenylobacterium sp. TaxID=1871053 RepID=UPI002737794F|nr:SDR family oxidoreductase [Phenylobacterium sp.]MDP3175430.1 SDR family oxidoreductase [Phenylobacterium sp.]